MPPDGKTQDKLKFVANWQESFIYLNSEKNLLKPGNTIKIQWPLN